VSNPFQVVRDFEAEICNYTGAPFAVAVNSCTSALMLAVAWHFAEMQRKVDEEDSAQGHGMRRWALLPPIDIPKRTYVSVPMAIIHAGGRPTFRDEEWLGIYQLRPLPVYDCARLFTSNMYQGPETLRCFPGFKTMAVQIPHPGDMLCVSFHASKTLGLEQGGAILHDDPEADAWLRRARFDGRTEGVVPKDDNFTQIGWHCVMNPSTAAQGILRLHSLPRHNEPLQNDDYPDLSLMDIFK
jgi:dTDP-4-amino-4,6-dideoxygalactose transaminase